MTTWTLILKRFLPAKSHLRMPWKACSDRDIKWVCKHAREYARKEFPGWYFMSLYSSKLAQLDVIWTINEEEP